MKKKKNKDEILVQAPTKASIVQRLLDNGELTAKEAVVLLESNTIIKEVVKEAYPFDFIGTTPPYTTGENELTFFTTV